MIKDLDGLEALGESESRNVMFHIDPTTMTEADMTNFAAKAKRDLFCSVVIAQGGKTENFIDSYNKLQAPNFILKNIDD